MGIVNITADSFADGGKFLSLEKAYSHVFRMIESGADIIDIGGESTRPQSTPIPVEVELKRVIPLIEAIRAQSSICISIDTYKPEVMTAAVHAGATIINDIYALQQEGALAVAKQLAVPICLMHMQGQPQTMQANPQYPQGIMTDLLQFFEQRIAICEQQGIARERLILDPGFGYGKLLTDNLTLLRCIEQLKRFNLPLLLGASRKASIGAVLQKEVDDRLVGSIAVAVYAALSGVSILRTHDVDETNQALTMIKAIFQADDYKEVLKDE